jgi:predicted nucleic acid-binding protein
MLDTNTCVFIMKKVESVVAEFRTKAKYGVCVSSIVLSELEYGIAKSLKVSQTAPP